MPIRSSSKLRTTCMATTLDAGHACNALPQRAQANINCRIFPGAVGIPTYGVPGLWLDADGNGIHGLNERIEVAALYTGRDFLNELVARYAAR